MKTKQNGTNKGAEDDKSILLAFPIFTDNKNYNLTKVIEHLKSFWGLTVSGLSGNDNTTVFDIDGQSIALASMPDAIPEDELDDVINYTYLWKDARKALKAQTSHAIVSLLGNDRSHVERHMIFSKLLCSILMTTPECLAIYQGQESLLLQRDFYLSCVDDLLHRRIPVPAWIYIGIRNTEHGFDAYTFGMTTFDKNEIEILNTPIDPENLYMLILNIASYCIGSDVNFKDGETFDISESVKMNISVSKGVYLEENTVKVEL